MRRFAPGHVPDLGNPHLDLQHCSCGFLADNKEALLEHAYNPKPEMPLRSVPRVDFINDRTEVACGRGRGGVHSGGKAYFETYNHHWTCPLCGQPKVTSCKPCRDKALDMKRKEGISAK